MEAKIGRMVQHKSGGPTMTITALYRDMEGRSQAVCTWFDAQQNAKSGRFRFGDLAVAGWLPSRGSKGSLPYWLVHPS